MSRNSCKDQEARNRKLSARDTGAKRPPRKGRPAVLEKQLSMRKIPNRIAIRGHIHYNRGDRSRPAGGPDAEDVPGGRQSHPE